MFEASSVLLILAAVFYLAIVVLLCVVIVMNAKVNQLKSRLRHRIVTSETAHNYYYERELSF